MSELKHTDHTLVSMVKAEAAPRSGQTLSGYGGAIPSRFMVKYDGRWHRVYMMVYGNSGSPYIKKNGETLHLDIDTSHDLEDIA